MWPGRLSTTNKVHHQPQRLGITLPFLQVGLEFTGELNNGPVNLQASEGLQIDNSKLANPCKFTRPVNLQARGYKKNASPWPPPTPERGGGNHGAHL